METFPLPAPDGSGAFVVVLDLHRHEAAVEHSDGRARCVPLTPDRAVAEPPSHECAFPRSSWGDVNRSTARATSAGCASMDKCQARGISTNGACIVAAVRRSAETESTASAAAEHLLPGDPALAGEQRADPVGELFVVGHQPEMSRSASVEERRSESTGPVRGR